MNYTLLQFIPIWLCLIGTSFSIYHSQAQCLIDSTVATLEPGIYPNSLPDIQNCQPLDQVFTFKLPRDTVFRFLGSDIRIAFESFSIANVEGLPPGIDWQCNLAPECIYDVSPGNSAPDTIGCVRLFGTPNILGDYVVKVDIVAEVGLLGEQEASFEIPVTITDCSDLDTCILTDLSSNCTPTSLYISTLNTGSLEGRVEWEIMKDNEPFFQSFELQPDTILITEGGTYIISYKKENPQGEVIIENISLRSIQCDDLINSADLYWKFIDPKGEVLFSNESDPKVNSGDDLPISLDISDISIDSGVYELQVWDNDLFGDEACGNDGASLFFNVLDSLQGLSDIPAQLAIGDMGLEITLTLKSISASHVLSCEDTVHVFEELMSPTILQKNGYILSIQNPKDELIYRWIGEDGTAQAIGTELEVFEEGEFRALAIDTINNCHSAPSSPIFINPISTSIDTDPDIQWVVYPNPVKRWVRLSWKTIDYEKYSWTISDITGKSYLSGDFPQNGGNHLIKLDLGSLSSGVYMLEIRSLNSSFTQLLYKN